MKRQLNHREELTEEMIGACLRELFPAGTPENIYAMLGVERPIKQRPLPLPSPSPIHKVTEYGTTHVNPQHDQ